MAKRKLPMGLTVANQAARALEEFDQFCENPIVAKTKIAGVHISKTQWTCQPVNGQDSRAGMIIKFPIGPYRWDQVQLSPAEYTEFLRRIGSEKETNYRAILGAITNGAVKENPFHF